MVNMKSWQGIILGSGISFLLAGLIFLIAFQPRGTPIQLNPRPTVGPIVVSVQGLVQNPGIYSLPESARVDDAIQAAGGFLSGADRNEINLAARLHDEQQIVVYGQNAERPSSTANPVEESTTNSVQTTIDYPININTATSEQLQKLPGIGPTRAEAILQYRAQNGDFTNIDEIQNVDGIGSSTFDQIKSLISIGDTGSIFNAGDASGTNSPNH
jgi:competence protein ComEA